MAIKYDPVPLLKAAGVFASYEMLVAKGGSVKIFFGGGTYRLLIEYPGHGTNVLFLSPNTPKPSEWPKIKLVALGKAFLAAGKEKWMVEEGQKVPKVKASPASIVCSDRVRLEEATELYQPVFGTDPQSKYYVVGIADGLKVAARIASDNVSLKVVGTRINEIKDRLTSLGFSGKEKGHWSAHITCSHTTPSKLIGAVLLGLGVEFETGIPNVHIFANLS